MVSSSLIFVSVVGQSSALSFGNLSTECYARNVTAHISHFECAAGTHCCGSNTLTPSCVDYKYNTCCEFNNVAIVCGKNQTCDQVAGAPICKPNAPVTPTTKPTVAPVTTAKPATWCNGTNIDVHFQCAGSTQCCGFGTKTPSCVDYRYNTCCEFNNVAVACGQDQKCGHVAGVPVCQPLMPVTTAKTTDAPVNTTAAPVTTDAPVNTTAAPVTTDAPVNTTAAPVTTAKTTDAPVTNTETTMKPTVVPVTTAAPSEWCNGTNTDVHFRCAAPAQCCGFGTRTPSCIEYKYNTCCEFNNVAVACGKDHKCDHVAGLPVCKPLMPVTTTDAPVNTTAAPVTTDAPVTTTAVPVTTDAPVNTTAAPVTTDAPVNTTAVPVTTAKPTDAPVTTSEVVV